MKQWYKVNPKTPKPQKFEYLNFNTKILKFYVIFDLLQIMVRLSDVPSFFFNLTFLMPIWANWVWFLPFVT